MATVIVTIDTDVVNMTAVNVTIATNDVINMTAVVVTIANNHGLNKAVVTFAFTIAIGDVIHLALVMS